MRMLYLLSAIALCDASDGAYVQKKRRLMVHGPRGNTNPPTTAPVASHGGIVTVSPPSSVGGSSKALKKSKTGLHGSVGRGPNNAIGACTCTSCTQEVLKVSAKGLTCGQRIDYLLQNYSQAFSTKASACERIAGIEFPQGTVRSSQ
jgi:hypothetical protein